MPKRKSIPPALPEVGIFWFIQKRGQGPMLVGSGVAVRNGERYGANINYPGDHSQYWLEIKPCLPPFFHDCGPKDWPRGRVIYNTQTKRYEVYLNEQLQTPKFKAEILAYFNLTEAETSFGSDPHYTDVRFELGPGDPEVRAG